MHTIHSVQTICILLQVAHNLGQSDQISVLLACAIKIAQSINLHRLGSDISVPSAGRSQQALIDREVKKRVWWFLVRQDWLQIPFQNTYSIHITQFNTPMPLNCYEDPERMVRCREVLDNHIDVYTQSSYSNVLNQGEPQSSSLCRLQSVLRLFQVSVVVWRHQDRLVSVGHPEKSSDGIYKLYDQVLLADEELRDVWRKMPKFLHDENIELAEWPHNVAHIKRIHHLSMAHKVFRGSSLVSQNATNTYRCSQFTATSRCKVSRMVGTLSQGCVRYLVVQRISPCSPVPDVLRLYCAEVSTRHGVLANGEVHTNRK